MLKLFFYSSLALFASRGIRHSFSHHNARLPGHTRLIGYTARLSDDEIGKPDKQDV